MKWIKRFLGMEEKATNYSADDLIEAYEHAEREIRNAGSFNGKHYTEYIECVKQLKRERKHEEAIKLLLEIVSAVEREARMAEKLNRGAPWFIAPGYYKELAIIYRKEKHYDKEVEIIERYCDHTKAPGARVSELEQRLIRAKELKDKQKS